MGVHKGKPFFRAEQVGSFLRPPRLLEARERFEKGALDREALWAIENDLIADVVKLQEDAGLQVVTDGEFRRTNWWFDFINALEGIEIVDADVRSGFSNSGTQQYFPKTVKTVGPIRRQGEILAPEYSALAARTLLEMGFSRVVSLRGGWSAWLEAKLPVER